MKNDLNVKKALAKANKRMKPQNVIGQFMDDMGGSVLGKSVLAIEAGILLAAAVHILGY